MFEDFSNFITACPTPYHFTEYARQKLLNLGFQELKESDAWDNVPLKGFIIRDERCLVAWNDGGHECGCFAGSHSDSPCLILKPKFDELIAGYRRARCSAYGGGLWYTWFDRDLKLAGRVLYRTETGIKSVLYDSQVGIATIPLIAMHFDLSFIYSTKDTNLEDNFIPIYGTESDPPLQEFIASQLSIKSEDIVSLSLRFVDANPPNQVNDILTCQRLDNMQNTYIILKSFLDAPPEDGHFNMICVFDNEEIGSQTRCGAMAAITDDILQRIIKDVDINTFKAKSLFLSCDSNHATHPNFTYQKEINHVIYLGKGMVIERDPNQDCANGLDNELSIRQAAKAIGVNIQTYSPTNLGSGGSTIGPIVETRSGILTVDTGAPVLGMHSIRENGTMADLESGYKLVCELYRNYKKYQNPF